jgi:hypothetical protein
MPEEKTSVLCPACKTRMSIRQLAYVTAEDIDEFVYHCPMCDAEIKSGGHTTLRHRLLRCKHLDSFL